MKEVLEIIKELRGLEWASKRGAFVYALALFFLSATIISIFYKTGVVLGPKWTIVTILGLQIVHAVAWTIKRNYFYDPNTLTLAFAITTEDASQNYYREIKKKFREQIATHRLQDDIRVKELPSDISFSDAKSAEAFIVKKGIRLLVWGNTSEGNISNAPFSQFNVKLSYQHGVINKEKQKKFVDDIEMAIQRRVWGIRQPDSFFHLAVVSGNVFEISLYTLGACLATIPNVNYLLKSVDIFERLADILKTRKQDINFPNLQLVKQKVRSFLRDAYTFLSNRLKDIDKAIEYADKAIRMDENNFNAHQSMALFQWLKGNKDKAHFHTERAWRIRPGHPLPRFNKAFFLIYDRKYEQGLKQYKKIQYVGDTNIVDVIEFLEKEFEKFEDNLGLLFVSGWINIQYADQVRGTAQLKTFLEKSKSDASYSILRDEVRKILPPEEK